MCRSVLHILFLYVDDIKITSFKACIYLTKCPLSTFEKLVMCLCLLYADVKEKLDERVVIKYLREMTRRSWNYTHLEQVIIFLKLYTPLKDLL